MKNLIEEINQLKKEMNAIILVHNYQRPEIYKVADFIGDSYSLSLKAKETDAEIIVFCGVHFMAESASIINPEKKVLLPAINAGCPMADMVNPEDLRLLNEKYPDAAVVSYINTNAATKAESDVICTSSNAIKVVNSLPNRRIIFVPDRNLASYVAKHTDKEIIPWDGFCYVHQKFSAEAILQALEKLDDSELIAHPECPEDVRNLSHYISSTSGMLDCARKSSAKNFIIATEVGMLEMLKQKLPHKNFYLAPPGGTCVNMKRNTLDLVLKSLKECKYEVVVPEEIRLKAERALERMLEVTK